MKNILTKNMAHTCAFQENYKNIIFWQICALCALEGNICQFQTNFGQIFALPRPNTGLMNKDLA